MNNINEYNTVILVPCYFNEKTSRANLFLACLNSILDTCNYEIIVLWMNGDKFNEFMIFHPRIKYHVKEKMFTGDARNYLLTMFYSFEMKKYAYLIDDDVVVLSDKFFKESKEEVKNVSFDVITYKRHTFSNLISRTQECHSMCLLINKKNKRYFFDKKLSSNLDLDFGYKIASSNGILLESRKNSLLFNYDQENSSMFRDLEDRKNKSRINISALMKKYFNL